MNPSSPPDDGRPEVVRLLGVTVHAYTMETLNRALERLVATAGPAVVANHNLHSVHVFHRDSTMRRFYELAECIHVDGMPLIFWARLLDLGLDRRHRITYVDWCPRLMSLAAARRWRVFWLGSRADVVTAGLRILRQRNPRLDIQGHHGYFDPRPGEAENRAVLERITAYHPQLLLLGMGMGRQERWACENFSAIGDAVILQAGAMLDYVAGAVPTPPRWMGRIGLEWLFRLRAEPRRLAHRYLIEPLYLLPRLWDDLRRRGRSP